MRYRSGAPQQALRDLEKAFKNFLTIPKRGFPKFKKKGRKDSFYLEGSIKVLKGNYIKLPRIGIVKTYEILPSVPIKNVTISKRADNWYISFKYDYQPTTTAKKRDIIGVDVGVNTLATCSDGTKFANIKAYRQAKKRLARYQHRVRKKEPGFLRNATQTKNRLKAIKRLAKAHKKADATPRRRKSHLVAHQAVADIRADTLHKLTTWASFKPQHHSDRSMTMSVECSKITTHPSSSPPGRGWGWVQTAVFMSSSVSSYTSASGMEAS